MCFPKPIFYIWSAENDQKYFVKLSLASMYGFNPPFFLATNSGGFLRLQFGTSAFSLRGSKI